ncbi:hypothetical protein [Shewanella algae]|uniref:hypothetical protein n=1 Tax=Shewanella algae TaxID=38313 RepID=UPI001BEDD5FB|nr:hypothetical protein [Shewanella algae]BCV40848.1 hypothetical protein TUM17378_21100 [Shewanella algae]
MFGEIQTAIPAPNLNTSPMNNSWFSGVNDLLSMGLDSWMKYEQINAMKDAGQLGQKELQTTVQTPNPNSDQTYVNPAQVLKEKMAGGLQIGVGTLAAVVGGVAVLYWLTRK